MFKQSIQNQSGFSLIQAIILAGLVAGMAYIGTELMTEQKLTQRGMEQRANNERIHSMIYSIMQNKDHCTQTFNTHSINSTTVLTLGTSYAFGKIVPANTSGEVFRAKSGADYLPEEKYMNNTIGIPRMRLTMPTASWDDHATLRIVYERLGKGFAGKMLTRNISIKIQRTAGGNFLSCYAVEEGTNQDLIKDFCETLGADDGNPATVDSIFEWDPNTNSCKLKDLQCPSGQIFAGFDSTGKRRCFSIQNWTNFSNFLDTTSASSCEPGTATNVRFVMTAGNKVKVECGSSGGGPSCSTHCDCAVNQKCSGGACVPVGGTCTHGETGNGGMCDFICSGGFWACSAAPYSCSSTNSCTTPWGDTILHGDMVTAFASSSPSCPAGCQTETRVCNNGVLSGSYTEQFCTDPGCSGSCTSYCDCGSSEYCNAALGCQPIANPCTPGDTANGGTCELLCDGGGNWTCSASPYTCSAGPSANACCPSTGSMVVDCSSCPPLGWGMPNQCPVFPPTLQCAP